MARSDFWILYGHILAACLFEGGMVFFGILLANLKRRLTPEEFSGEVSALLRFYHPFSLICMGALILTGAWYLTGLKAAMGANFGRIFVPLGLKLLAVFALVMGMSFQFFAIGLRLTRGTGPAGNGKPLSTTLEDRLGLIRTLSITNTVNAVIGLMAIFFGLALSKGF
ncbi:MAG: hypothetical protein O2807_02320 [bacterium]|nr:hypothetical protein [bacterium]